eukprot:m.59874 g.59874  ORF g.59874 m.59874 type:complete len:538 (-) comp11279_c0_seq1:113-1726(-)
MRFKNDHDYRGWISIYSPLEIFVRRVSSYSLIGTLSYSLTKIVCGIPACYSYKILGVDVMSPHFKASVSFLILAWLGYGSGGPRMPILYNMFGENHMVAQYGIRELKPGYEEIRDIFINNLVLGVEDGAQFTAYVNGEVVVDIFGSVASSSSLKQPNTPKSSDHYLDYDGNSLQCIYSSSKVVTSIAMGMMVDRGLISYDTKVIDVWPEFEAYGKEHLTVRDVMKHEAGIPEPPPRKISLVDLTSEGIKRDKVGEVYANEKSIKDEKQPRIYHGVTRGFLVNEILRRVDPENRTLGEFIEEEIADPLELNSDIFLGTPDSVQPRTYTNYLPRLSWIIAQWWMPIAWFLPSRWGMPPLFSAIAFHNILEWKEYSMFKDIKGVGLNELVNMEKTRCTEMPSINMFSNAYALATIANAVVGKTGHMLFKNNGRAEMEANPTLQNMGGFPLVPIPCHFTDGGLSLYNQENKVMKIPLLDDCYGWQGYTGSYMIYHKSGDFAFSYVPTMFGDMRNKRSFPLVRKVVQCAKKLHGINWPSLDS